jgi:adenosylhomocysteinase
MAKTILHDVKDLSLAAKGKLRIEWAGQSMAVLKLIEKRFAKEKPLKGIRIGACLHVTAETANLMLALKAGGASLSLCASNPLSTQDDVAASLVKDSGISTFAIKGEDTRVYYKHLNAVLDTHPQLTMDDGADLVSLLHKERKNQLIEVIGSNEETTTGVIRLKAMEKDKALKIPVFAVNDSDTKHMFDNRYGTGQSTLDGIMRATNVLLAGKTFVVAGYGWCGRGLASRARGMGAHVIVTEVDPIKALEAVMDGFVVMRIADAVKIGDIFVTVTGDKHVISLEHILKMKDGAIIANSGHFNVEIAVDELAKKAKSRRQMREYVDEYTLADGSRRYVLAQGRLINLSAAEGHPAEVMDMSFANQALAAEFFVQSKGNLKVKVYTISPEMDREIARLKLVAMGIKFDTLTSEQKKYLGSWEEGT